MEQNLTWEDFGKVEIRMGKVVDAAPYPEARKPAIKIWVDFGETLGVRKSSAQLTAHYTPESLIGKQVVAVVNFPPRQIGKFMSEFLVVGIPDENGQPVLVSPDKELPLGGRLFQLYFGACGFGALGCGLFGSLCLYGQIGRAGLTGAMA